MAGGVADVIERQRQRASFHEGSHFAVARSIDPAIEIIAHVGQHGGGDSLIWFPPYVSRTDRLLVSVAGFLGEAKGMSQGSLSDDRTHARQIAADVDRRLRLGEQAFQVDVLMADGDTRPGTTNNKDFALLLADIGSRARNFRAFVGLDSWANEIQNAILGCVVRLEHENLWGSVQDVAAILTRDGYVETEEVAHLLGNQA